MLLFLQRLFNILNDLLIVAITRPINNTIVHIFTKTKLYSHTYKNVIHFSDYSTYKKDMLPSGFEPESKPREGLMIGRTTLREQIKTHHPPEVTSTSVNDCPSLIISSNGTGLLLISVRHVSGLILNL